MRKNVQLHLASCQWCDKASPHSITTVQLHVRLLLGVGGGSKRFKPGEPEGRSLCEQALPCCSATVCLQESGNKALFLTRCVLARV
eukprot:scaffold306663_cov15-Tisochrysis_lutea.AAC.1